MGVGILSEFEEVEPQVLACKGGARFPRRFMIGGEDLTPPMLQAGMHAQSLK